MIFSNIHPLPQWELSYKDLLEPLRAASGDYSLSLAIVRSRGNSLGFKTEKSMLQGSQKRRITCNAKVFESLKKRYIPEDELVEHPHKPEETVPADGTGNS